MLDFIPMRNLSLVNFVHMLQKWKQAFKSMWQSSIQNLTKLGLLILNHNYWKINTVFCNLLQKIPIYFGPKQWKCPFCEKVMAEKGSMKKHIMLHTGEKPYSCQFCDLKCNRTYNLKAHVRNKHSDIVMFWPFE